MEVALITGASIIIVAVIGVLGRSNSRQHDVGQRRADERASDSGVHVEALHADVREMKADLGDIKGDLRDLRQRVTGLERPVRQHGW